MINSYFGPNTFITFFAENHTSKMIKFAYLIISYAGKFERASLNKFLRAKNRTVCHNYTTINFVFFIHSTHDILQLVIRIGAKFSFIFTKPIDFLIILLDRHTITTNKILYTSSSMRCAFNLKKYVNLYIIWKAHICKLIQFK